jgi:hypothetical protein
MLKRSNFYPNGEIIDFFLPQSFRKSLTKEACGNCGLYSNRRSFCGRWGSKGVKDNYVCHFSMEKKVLSKIIL